VPLRCIVVDDNNTFLASATRLLEIQGAKVVGVASTGSEALRLAANVRPDLALVDVQLGAESGIQVARSLVNLSDPPRVVLVSTYTEDELVDVLRGSPADGFLHKSMLSVEALEALLA
jgi:DNA-binding NarL/FixJ family response regulator